MSEKLQNRLSCESVVNCFQLQRELAYQRVMPRAYVHANEAIVSLHVSELNQRKICIDVFVGNSNSKNTKKKIEVDKIDQDILSHI